LGLPTFLVTLLRVLFDWWSEFATTMHFSACGRTKNKGTKTIDLIPSSSYHVRPLGIAVTDSDCLRKWFVVTTDKEKVKKVNGGHKM
jgi:hypothetical protein